MHTKKTTHEKNEVISKRIENSQINNNRYRVLENNDELKEISNAAQIAKVCREKKENAKRHNADTISEVVLHKLTKNCAINDIIEKEKDLIEELNCIDEFQMKILSKVSCSESKACKNLALMC